MNIKFAERVFRAVYVFVFIVGTVWVPTTDAGASPALALGDGLHAEYRNLGGTEIVLTVHGEGPINHGWNGSCPGTDMYQNVCASWAGMFNSWSLLEETLTGYIEAPATGTYEFHSWIDDYLQITINGVTQTADDIGGAGYSIVMDLVEGQFYPVTMYFMNRGGSANLSLFWTKPDATYEVVPKQYLYTEIPAQNNVPVIAEGDSVAVTMSVNGTPKPFNLTLNATDADAADTLTWSILTPASHGTASASGTGLSKEIGYSPEMDYVGADGFVVQVDDGNGGTDSITVNVMIGAVTIYVPDDYSTIQAAADAANPGDTVFVRAGTYYEHVVVNKSLTLQGADKVTTIIDGSGSGYGIHLPSVDNVTIADLTVRNSRSAIFLSSGADNNVVRRVIAANSEYGLDNGDTSNTHNTYQDVEVYGNTSTGIIGYANSHYMTIVGANVHDNNVGIGIGWSSYWSVSGSTITNNQYGIIIDTATQGTVTNNSISNSVYDGIHFNGWGPTNNNVTGNQVQDNGRAGLYFQCTARSNTSTDNVISGNAYGVWITRNDTCPNYGNTFYHNTFSNNTIQAQDDEDRYGGNTWDNGYPSGGNTWDTYTGVDLFSGAGQDVPGADGIGDTPYLIFGGNNQDSYPLMQPLTKKDRQ